MTNPPIIEKLISSIESLQDAACSARARLADSPTGKHYLYRLDQYDKIATEQLKLVPVLAGAIAREDTAQVTRLVGVINGMSALIREDSLAMLEEISGQKAPPSPEELN